MAITSFPKFADSRPSVQATIDDSNITGTSSSSDKKLMLVGEAEGGNPDAVYELSNYNTAKEIFRGGELLNAIQLAWNPTPEGTYYAGNILAIRSQPASTARLTVGPLTFTSILYSKLANDIQVKLSDNSITNTKRLTVLFNNDNVNTVYDNLGSVLDLSYTGNLGYASVEVTHGSNGYADQLILKAGASKDAAQAVATIKLGDSAEAVKIGDLINTINAYAGFNADFFEYGTHNIQTKYMDTLPETQLRKDNSVLTAIAGDILRATANDNVVEVDYDPFGGVVTEPENVKVTVEGNEATVDATAQEDEVPVENFPFTNLDGGSTGVSPSSWGDKFQKFANENGAYYLVPLTDDESIHAEADAFVRDQSDLGNPMRAIVGGDIAESKRQAITRAARLDSARSYVVAQSVQKKQNDGTVLSYPGYMTAAMIGGVASGLPKGASVTYKYLDIIGTDVIFTNDELNELDSAGVISIEHVRNSASTSNFRITDDISTLSGSESPVDTEMGVGEDSDMFITSFRTYLDNNLIGEKLSINSPSVIKSKVMSFLDEAVNNGLIYDYDSSQISVETINKDGSRLKIVTDVDISRNIKHIQLGVIYDEDTLSTSASTN